MYIQPKHIRTTQMYCKTIHHILLTCKRFHRHDCSHCRHASIQGGEEAKADRTYRDEVEESTAEHMDDVLRVWLPPDLLGRFNL